MRWGISRLRTGQLTWFHHQDDQGWYHWLTHTKREFQWLHQSFLLELWHFEKEEHELKIGFKHRIILPENLMLYLKLQFRFESLRSIRPESADFEKSRGGQSFIQLREIINTTSVNMQRKRCRLTFGQVGTSSRALSVRLNLSWMDLEDPLN